MTSKAIALQYPQRMIASLSHFLPTLALTRIALQYPQRMIASLSKRHYPVCRVELRLAVSSADDRQSQRKFVL